MNLNINLNRNNKEEKEVLNLIERLAEDMKTTPYTPVYSRSVKRLLMDATKEYKDGKFHFERTIEFPSQAKLAGLNLLIYYADKLNRKYKDENIKVVLKQADDIISLLIKSDDEKLLEEIKLDLEDYGEVLLEQKSIQDYVGNDRLETIRLQSALNMAKVQIEMEKSLREFQTERLNSVENQNKLLNNYVGTILQLQGKAFEVSENVSGTNLILSKTLFEKFAEIRNDANNSTVEELILKIEESYINNDILNNEEIVKEYLKEIQKRDKKTFDKLFKFGKEMSNSVAGNLLWQLIQMIPI